MPLDFRSDIYSTGVVLYEVFTGTLPFEGDTPLAVVLKHIQEAPPSPQSRNPEDRSEDLADHPEVHGEGPEGPLTRRSTISTRR